MLLYPTHVGRKKQAMKDGTGKVDDTQVDADHMANVLKSDAQQYPLEISSNAIGLNTISPNSEALATLSIIYQLLM